MKAICFIALILIVYSHAQIPGFDQFQKSVKENKFVAQVNDVTQQIKDYADYISKTGKTYASNVDRALREQTFAANKAIIEANNKLYESGKQNFKLGLNKLSDIPKIDFLKKFTSRKKTEEGDKKLSKIRKATPDTPPTTIPDSYDWRDHGFTTPVRYQGECGSCWAFGAVQSIEAHYFIKNKKNINLSVQNLVDCSSDYGNEGCDGGYQEYAFGYILDNQGITSEETYPYKEKNDTCKYQEKDQVLTLKGYSTIAPKNENLMKKVIATRGPLVCSVYAAADTFRLYKEGIYTDEECNSAEVNHAILVVGYGVDKDGQEYWTIKNSWDTEWGENGYMRIPRNKNSFCGIADECSFPVL